MVKNLIQQLGAKATGHHFGLVGALLLSFDRLRDFQARRSVRSRGSADPRVAIIIENLRRYGYHFINDFLTEEESRSLREKLDRVLAEKCGVLDPDTSHYDLRLRGIENVEPAFQSFANDPLLNKVAEAYLGEPSRTAFTLGARLDARPGNPGSGGGWHRDNFI